jgi:hypothetical protein
MYVSTLTIIATDTQENTANAGSKPSSCILQTEPIVNYTEVFTTVIKDEISPSTISATSMYYSVTLHRVLYFYFTRKVLNKFLFYTKWLF